MSLRKDIVTQDLALEALNQCPQNVSDLFEDGFVDFINTYFNYIEMIYSMASDHDCEDLLDFEYALENTYKDLKRESETEYWKGIFQATNISIKILKFNFEDDSEDFAA